MFMKINKKAAASVMAGLIATAAFAPMALATEGNIKAGKDSIEALNAPMEKLGSAMTGTVPKIGVTIAAAGGALSWAMGTEQQVIKYATRAAMGGGVAMAAPSVVADVTGQSSLKGFEF